MRHGPAASETSVWRDAVLEESLHHDIAFLRVKVWPVFGRSIGVKVGVFQVHLRIEILTGQVTLRHVVHVAKAGEAISPRQLAVVVEEESALHAFAILELPRAHRAPLHAVLMVSDNLQGRPSRVLWPEAPLEETAGVRVRVVLVLLDNVGFLFLPLGMLFYRFTGGEKLHSVDEDKGHIPDLYKVRKVWGWQSRYLPHRRGRAAGPPRLDSRDMSCEPCCCRTRCIGTM